MKNHPLKSKRSRTLARGTSDAKAHILRFVKDLYLDESFCLKSTSRVALQKVIGFISGMRDRADQKPGGTGKR